ncbi:hypothetical protein [Streptomyces griseoruber]|nr:hypothetical protein [Streptomyces griseoruber]
MAGAVGRAAAGDTRMPRAGVADGGVAGRTGCRCTTGTGAGEAEGDAGETPGRFGCGAAVGDPVGSGAVDPVGGGDAAPGRAGCAGAADGTGPDGDDTATGTTGEDPAAR